MLFALLGRVGIGSSMAGSAVEFHSVAEQRQSETILFIPGRVAGLEGRHLVVDLVGQTVDGALVGAVYFQQIGPPGDQDGCMNNMIVLCLVCHQFAQPGFASVNH
jgi:hypothetical protein